jgi:NTP pyrophosphatase (non-canonical NTP hydrolase)
VGTINLDDFQKQVSQLLIRHRSVLDVLSKSQEANARINRSITKAITECGCVEVVAKKQAYDPEKSLHENQPHLETHFYGPLCEHCKEVLTAELGKSLFYLAALCNITEIKLDDVIKAECDKLNTLGVFNLS